MNSRELLIEAHSRIPDVVHAVLDDVAPDVLVGRPDAEGNTVAWLVWHLTRVQDDHVSEVAGHEQTWTSAGWAGRFGLPFDEAETGYGHDAERVAQVQAGARDLRGYHDAVHEATRAYLVGLSDTDLDRVVDDAWDPPVTLGVRLISVIDDDVAHAAQATFLRGVLERRREA